MNSLILLALLGIAVQGKTPLLLVQNLSKSQTRNHCFQFLRCLVESNYDANKMEFLS